jgi:hypothetical protein
MVNSVRIHVFINFLSVVDAFNTRQKQILIMQGKKLRINTVVFNIVNVLYFLENQFSLTWAKLPHLTLYVHVAQFRTSEQQIEKGELERMWK